MLPLRALVRLTVAALLLAALGAKPLLAQSSSVAGGWQVFTVAHGLAEPTTLRVAPDGHGGLWVGHVSGGRGINRRGGFARVFADGTGRTYTAEPFASCSSMDALALAPDGTLWMNLSGIHDYGSTDYLGLCTQQYGAAIGFIGADGEPHMLSKEQIPADLTAGLAVDALGRLWAGTTRGAAVRDASGAWYAYSFRGSDESPTTALEASPDGMRVAVGDAKGSAALILIGQGVPGGAADGVTGIYSSPGQPHPVFDLAWTPTGVAMTIGKSLVRQAESGGWETLPLPFEGDDSSASYLAYAGGTFWAGVPGYPTGLFRLDPQGWTPIPAGATPLPSSVIHDLEAESATSLLIATDEGAARLDTAAPPADPAQARAAFDALWQRTNRGTGDSWVWGPFAWAERYEPYKQGPGGVRFVRYYDKARMELPQPGVDPASPWYVTNGLLVAELVRGLAQLGDDPAVGICPMGKRAMPCPSGYPVAGDANPNTNRFAPGYADFAELLPAAPKRVGARVGATFTQADDYDPFVLGEDRGLASAATTIAAYDDTTGHNIPRAFWAYMGRQPADWLFTFGHPITEPVWVRTQIRGVEQWVLVQLFERRALTYTPANAPAWQVEMGNVGQHYYAWRYGADVDNPLWARPLTAP
ncbi:MAG: hypothetical protein HGA45_15105 [Chloroflexales bacterium]|nr:hypothetical protein [Chloroflexales bacterium]